MLFNSLHFLLFFLVFATVYFSIPKKHQSIILLIASYYFYMCWKPEYVVLIFGSTILDFLVAKSIYNSSSQQKKKQLLSLSILANLGILVFFKYFNFLSENLSSLVGSIGLTYDPFIHDFLLPVGISFYTFQTLSYTIDVYRGNLAPESSFKRFALYVSFFPQLVAGPIERAGNLLPQFRKEYSFEYDRIVIGLRQVLWGFFKKVVIADNLALIVDTVYNNPADQNGLTFLIASVFFSFQIYCDFSGYSDIAIGTARILGFNLKENFRQPYFSRSLKEFWTRWHISLSSWFKDYVYIPLGGNRVVKWRWYYNLYLTFLISGIWHGANWTFVIWGSIHGIGLVLGIQLSKLISREPNRFVQALQILFVFIFVTVAWVFFRAESLHQAILVIKELTSVPSYVSDYLSGESVFNGLKDNTLLFVGYCILLIFFLLCMEAFSLSQKVSSYFKTFPALRMTAYFVLFYWIIFGGNFGKSEFIYFQF